MLLDWQLTADELDADADARHDKWTRGALDGHAGKRATTADADYMAGYAEGMRARRVVCVMPARPEGYYHAPLSTAD